ncbi:MAG: hypothetical protein KJP03_03210 [Gammaproteobacteria bacterium]|nr:hypothetical protein [Gammaproteobacteria bacterium]
MRARWLVGSLLLACAAWQGAAHAQINNEAYSDYFLFGRFGEVCTMCEVTVLCGATDVPPDSRVVPESGTFTIYHLQTRTFWSQISTIWEWFVANFSSESLAAKGHTRPVYVYQVSGDEWAGPNVVEARLLLEPGRLEFGDRYIDRTNQRWIDANSGAPAGYCSRLPLWDALAVINRQTGQVR